MSFFGCIEPWDCDSSGRRRDRADRGSRGASAIGELAHRRVDEHFVSLAMRKDLDLQPTEAALALLADRNRSALPDPRADPWCSENGAIAGRDGEFHHHRSCVAHPRGCDWSSGRGLGVCHQVRPHCDGSLRGWVGRAAHGRAAKEEHHGTEGTSRAGHVSVVPTAS